MLKKEIKVGGKYIAKVSNKLTVVRVDSIKEYDGFRGQYRRVRAETCYHCTNLNTGRKLNFRSAAKFRREST